MKLGEKVVTLIILCSVPFVIWACSSSSTAPVNTTQPSQAATAAPIPAAPPSDDIEARHKAVTPETALAAISERVTVSNPNFLGDVNTVGKKDAPVNLVVFQDLKCGMCARMYKRMFLDLNKSYVAAGKVKVTFMEFPLGLRLEESLLAEATKCAGEQGKYIKYLDYLYMNIAKTKAEEVGVYAKKVGLNQKKFDACVKERKYGMAVKADFQTGEELSVYGTPTMFINGKEVRGARDWVELKQQVDQELAEVRGKK